MPEKSSERRVPDGGYGWVVVFGAALAHFLLVGMARSLGVLYILLLDRYNGSASATAWVMATFNTCRTLIAPLCSIAVDKFGGRRVAMTGSLLLCIGFALSAFATQLWHLYILLGGIAGFGGAMVFVPAYVMVGKYFDKHKGKAMAFATIGSGFGNVFFAPVINMLFEIFGLFGALIIMGGCQLHNVIAGALYRPLPPPKVEIELEVVSKEVKEIGEEEETPLEKHSEQEGTLIEKEKEPTEKNDVEKQCCSPGSLLRNWTFYLYGFLVISMQTCIMTFLIFLPKFCTELGIDKATAALTLTLFGVFDMAGRFLFGFLFDLEVFRHRRRHLYCLPTSMFGLGVAAMTLQQNFVGVCVVTAFTALFEGAAHSQRATIGTEIVARHQMSRAVGVVIFCQGLGNVSGPPLAGVLTDLTGTSRWGFGVFGCLLMFASLLFLAQGIFCGRRCSTPTRD